MLFKNEDSVRLIEDEFKSRIVCVNGYTISDEDKPKRKSGEAECVLNHIRNALSHGNTYIFENKKIMLEDLRGGKITARMIFDVNTLINWIKLIDINEKFYHVDNIL